MDLNAINFLNSLYNYGQSGFKNVSDEELFKRLSICDHCEFVDKSLNRCNQCGCFLQIKAHWASERCPIGKWEAVTSSVESQQPEQVSDCSCNNKV
jgi:hypothetical protein